MENILHEMMTQVGVPLSHLDNILAECKKYILPNKEKGKGEGPLRISVRIKSLCAVMLWEKVKELKIKMSMVRFSEKCRVDRSMIFRVCKKIREFEN